MKHNPGANLAANFGAIKRALKLFFEFYPVRLIFLMKQQKLLKKIL